MKRFLLPALVLVLALLLSSCTTVVHMERSVGGDDLVGAWKGKVQFKTGAFAAVTDLDFLYVFNAGGTMTESSNYDAAPPVTPAYGAWKRPARAATKRNTSITGRKPLRRWMKSPKAAAGRPAATACSRRPSPCPKTEIPSTRRSSTRSSTSRANPPTRRARLWPRERG